MLPAFRRAVLPGAKERWLKPHAAISEIAEINPRDGDVHAVAAVAEASPPDGHGGTPEPSLEPVYGRRKECSRFRPTTPWRSIFRRESRRMSPIRAWPPGASCASRRRCSTRYPAADVCQETQSGRGRPAPRADCALASAGGGDPSGASALGTRATGSETARGRASEAGNALSARCMRGEGLRKLEPAWAHATGFWHHAPRDLKLLLFAIPALLALVFHPGLPRIAFAAPQTSTGFTGGFKRVLSDEWMNVRQTLENRAAVALDEDFRSGLDNWASPGGSTTEWSFDATGFVRPGPLALYRPSVNLTDYQVQFLGLIDKKALSWVVRAADFENFYVVKLEVVKPGPMPAIGLTRYAVINGKARDRHDVNIPLERAPGYALSRPDGCAGIGFCCRGSGPNCR